MTTLSREATVKRYHYDNHAQIEAHLKDFIIAYNDARRLGLTSFEYICKIWTNEPDRFINNPEQHIVGLNIYAHHKLDSSIAIMFADRFLLQWGKLQLHSHLVAHFSIVHCQFRFGSQIFPASFFLQLTNISIGVRFSNLMSR